MDPSNRRSRSHEERWASAAETFRRFVPDAEPAQVAGSLGRRLGPLGTFAFEVVGDMWNRPQLSRRDRSLLIISALAAQARDEELVLHTEIGIRHGLTRVEIEEILPHVAAYAGFPASMAASRQIDEGLRRAEAVERLSEREGATAKSDVERDADAAEVWAGLRGLQPGDPTDGLVELTSRLGDLGEVVYRWALGEVWARPQLSRRDRSVVVIAILTSLGSATTLAAHIRGGLNHGLDRVEIEEIITHLGLYAGLPRAIEAMTVARDVCDEMS